MFIQLIYGWEVLLSAIHLSGPSWMLDSFQIVSWVVSFGLMCVALVCGVRIPLTMFCEHIEDLQSGQSYSESSTDNKLDLIGSDSY